MSIDFTILADEINTDPTGRGYAPHVASGATNVVAALLNDILLTITITKRLIVREAFMVATDFGEVKSLGASERDVFGSLMGFDNVPGKTVDEVSQFFGPMTTSKIGLQAVLTRNGSRVEELFGENVIVRPSDVALALGGP